MVTFDLIRVFTLRFCSAFDHLRTCRLIPTAAGSASRVVDVYDNGGFWTTAQLSVARYWLAAASVGNVALFAGGWDGSALF